MTLRGIGSALAGVAVVALVVGAGLMNPVPTAPIGTDSLGPDGGELVVDYLDRAQATLSTVNGPTWALASFAAPITADEVIAATPGIRVSEVLWRVPIDRVQTPLVSIGVPDNDVAIKQSPGAAATRLASMSGVDERQKMIAAASVRSLSEDCSCAVGVVVRGDAGDLAVLAANPAVRALEAMPVDGTPWRAAVRPLLAEYVDVVVPGPDDGPIP
ncbi:hypothetical protein B2J88_02300 [Rhodococcus sp. SRB_17]|uniref:hypothetical protein n=1 Tax=Rhodococcus sp. OK302 TaxID=1882769 RepID=UPI000B93C510|nr:hypothetical protein [Rhodococcus sp. OK302]NMM83207.1 hypothetical protein [Rhodococcus sp. SRB_17]OYD70808.1 hypothetical protein BDB13_4449 [Rhodococcus sp. OK302]